MSNTNRSKILILFFLWLFSLAPNSGQEIKNVTELLQQRKFTAAEDFVLNLADPSNTIPKIVKNIYNNSDQSVNLFFDFAQATRSVRISFLILKSLHDEMKTNNNRNPYQLMALYRNLQHEGCKSNFVDYCERSKPILSEIQLENENSVAELLKSYIVKNDLKSNTEARKLADSIYIFHPSNSDKLMQRLINDTFSLVLPSQLARRIEYDFLHPPQIISGLEALFYKLADNNSLHSPAVLNISNYITEFSLSDEFQSISRTYKHSINLLIEKFPKCARNLKLNYEVCIQNRARNEYLYAAEGLFYREKYRSVYTTGVDHIGNNGAWRIVYSKNGGDKILLRSQAFKNFYLYALPDLPENLGKHFNRTVGLAFKSDDDFRNDGTLWSISLVGDYCYLSNDLYDEFLYSANEFDGGENNRYVFTLKEGLLEKFQWQIQNCD